MSVYYKFGRDCWRYPLACSAQALNLRRGGTSTPGSGTSVTANLAARTDYYALNNTAPIQQRLFTAVASAIQTALGSGTVTVTPQDSVDELDIGQERISIRWTGGIWALRPGTAPLLAQWLGFDPEVTEYRSASSGVIHAPWSYAGAWWSHNTWGGAAFLKVPERVSDVSYSSERLWDALAVDWGEQQLRVFQYDGLPSARVWRGRSLDANRARLASLGLGDPNATFEPVWRALQDSTNGVLVHHDVEVEEGLGIGARTWIEAVGLWAPQREYSGLFADMGQAGDYWRLEITTRIDTASSGFYPL